MIRTLLRIYWTNLRRDRAAQALIFVLPISFFSIFAMIFGGRGNSETGKVTVAVVDGDHTRASRRLIRALQGDGSLVVRLTAPAPGAGKGAAEPALDSVRAERLVREGELPVAILIPAGYDTSVARFDGAGAVVRILADKSDPVAPRMAEGLLQKAAMLSSPNQLARNGILEFERFAGGLTPAQKAAVDKWVPDPNTGPEPEPGDVAAAAGSNAAGAPGLLQVQTVDVLGQRKNNGMVSFYAAGIAVMFLLFSCSAGGGALLDELEAGTLERVLSSRAGMNGLLAGKWLYLVLLGMLQITVMFVWGMLVFHLDLLSHLPGFAVMTVFTAAVAAGFGLFLASLSRTRAQLAGFSTLVILTMSALGGSMFPRFLMSEGMQKLGLVTFNAWALDGYVKVFWRDAPIADLAPQAGVLVLYTVVFLVAARLLARRWEAS